MDTHPIKASCAKSVLSDKEIFPALRNSFLNEIQASLDFFWVGENWHSKLIIILALEDIYNLPVFVLDIVRDCGKTEKE